MSSNSKQKFKVGDKVGHDLYGVGYVTVENHPTYTVKFGSTDGYLCNEEELKPIEKTLTDPPKEDPPKSAIPFYEETFADGIEWYRTEPFGNWRPKSFRSLTGIDPNRAMIAAMAMQGLLANSNPQILTMTEDSFAKMSIKQADALIAELQKPKQ
jgi:hypothetical protein